MTGGPTPRPAPAAVLTCPACPACRGPLDPAPGAALLCGSCDGRYPIHAGVPDLRLFPDPYLGLEEDRQRTERVLAALNGSTLESLLEYYWSLSDITPPSLRRRFVRSALLADSRARAYLDGLAALPLSSGRQGLRVLEIGSGTGAFLAAAVGSGVFGEIVGTDIAMRWIHLSRRRFMDLGLEPPRLYCCCAEHLPFSDAAFDVVVAFATLEFVRDPRRVFAECARVLRADGTLILTTANRFSLAPDPHSGLFGVGFLPRRLQGRYVRSRRGADHAPIRRRSIWEVDRLAAEHFPRREFRLADLPDEAVAALTPRERRLIGAYRSLKRLAVTRRLLMWLGPEWEIRLSRS